MDDNVLRKLCEDVAGIKASSDARDRQLVGMEADIREARDGVRELAAAHSEQNFPAKFIELRSEMLGLDKDRRSDLLNVADKIRTEVKAVETRLSVLENTELKRSGVTAALKAVKEYWPLVTGIGAVILALSGKIHL